MMKSVIDKPPRMFDRLPRMIIEYDIFSYLRTEDLFFGVRAVSVEWFEIIKNLWCTKIKEEMLDQVKMIDLIYEKEVLVKTVEFKIEYLINYKNLLTLYNSNTNVLELIYKSFIECHQDEEHTKLFCLYFSFFSMEEPLSYILDSDLENLKLFTSELHNFEVYKERFNFVIQGNSDFGLPQTDLLKFREMFSIISKEAIEISGDNSKIIYSLLQGLIEYEILKHDIKELGVRHQFLIKKIQETTDAWPKKKRFFENAYKLMLNTM